MNLLMLWEMKKKTLKFELSKIIHEYHTEHETNIIQAISLEWKKQEKNSPVLLLF